MSALWTPRNHHRRLVLAPKAPEILSLPYLRKVLAIAGRANIGLWPQSETSGTVAYDLSGRGHHGAYTGVRFTVPGAEIFGNPGFETAGGGGADVFGTWAESALGTGGAIADEAVDVYAGAHAAKLTAASDVNVSLYQNAAVVPWAQYALAFQAHGDGTKAPFYKVTDVTNTGDIIANTTTGITGTAYQRTLTSFAAPGGCVSARPILYLPSNGGIAYFDDASLVAAAPNGPISGLTAPYFDGVSAFTNIYSAALAAAFNGARGTLLTWARVGSAGVWTDGAARNIITIGNGNDIIAIRRTTNNGEMRLAHFAGATLRAVDYTTSSPTGWVPYALTWSVSANAVKAYMLGAQIGAVAGPAAWGIAPVSTLMVIGAASTVPASVYSGLIGLTLLCDRDLSPAEIAALSVA